MPVISVTVPSAHWPRLWWGNSQARLPLEDDCVQRYAAAARPAVVPLLSYSWRNHICNELSVPVIMSHVMCARQHKAEIQRYTAEICSRGSLLPNREDTDGVRRPRLLRGRGAPHQCSRVHQKLSGWGEVVTYAAHRSSNACTSFFFPWNRFEFLLGVLPRSASTMWS